MWLKHVFALWKHERKKKGTTLHRRLLLFFVSVTLVLILTFALLLSLFGITGRDSKTVNNYFDVELANISDNISDDFGAISLTGIDIAEELTDLSEDFFLENGVAASDLKSRTDMIEPLLSEYMHTLLRTVGNQYCGGVFVMLDATINPESELSDTAKAGVFLKKTQPTQTASVGVDIHYLRGPAQLARDNGIMLLGQWQMEYDISEQAFFTEVMETARANPELALSRLYYWSGRITLKGNSESGFLLCVPLRSSDGTVFGLCGIEVSDRMFKSLYSPDGGTYEGIFTVMAPDCEDGLCSSKGLVAGNAYLTGNRWESDLTNTNNHDGFSHYSGDNGDFAGKTASIRLYPGGSPYEGEKWAAALLMPQNILHDAVKGNHTYFIAIVVVLLVLSVIASAAISHRYLKPVVRAFEQIKNKTYSENGIGGGYSEIDDLFEFLAQKDLEHDQSVLQHQREMADLQDEHEKTKSELMRVAGEKKQEIDPDSYALFVTRLQELTKRERAVFDLYLDGKTAKEILVLLNLSDNGLKYHNKNIYNKLGVSSRKELLRYAAIMKQDKGGI